MQLYKNYLAFLVIASLFVIIQAKTDILLEEYGSLGTKAEFYDEPYLNGQQTSVNPVDGACKNLPRRWRKRAQSVDTLGTCVLACTEIECEGTCVRVYPAHGDQQLSTIKMSQAISSIKSCFK